MNDDIIFEAKSIQTSNIKTLFEVLKEVLIEVNLIVTNDRIKVISLNNTETSFIHVNLNAEGFESYYCERTEENPLILGIHTDNIFKIMKTIKHDETLSFSVTKKNPYNLFIRKENVARNSIHVFKLQLHEIPHHSYDIPSEIEMQTTIVMSSIDFQKMCKDYHGLGAKKLEIKNTGNQLFFSSSGDFSSFEATIGNSTNTAVENRDGESIIQGTYDLKYLLLFSKASNLSNIVEIYLKNDYPLIMNYKIGTLGDLKFIVSLIEEN